MFLSLKLWMEKYILISYFGRFTMFFFLFLTISNLCRKKMFKILSFFEIMSVLNWLECYNILISSSQIVPKNDLLNDYWTRSDLKSENKIKMISFYDTRPVISSKFQMKLLDKTTWLSRTRNRKVCYFNSVVPNLLP